MSDGTNAPFRELFVELRESVLDILRGMVDGQMQRLAIPPAFKASVSLALCEAFENGPVGRVLCKSYGWKEIVAQRSAFRTTIDIVCVRPCRYREHCPEFCIRDNTLEDVDANLMADLVMQMFARAARRPCYCVAPRRPWWVDDATPELPEFRREDLGQWLPDPPANTSSRSSGTAPSSPPPARRRSRT